MQYREFKKTGIKVSEILFAQNILKQHPMMKSKRLSIKQWIMVLIIRIFLWDLLKRFNTDYIDMLMLHYIDEMDDLDVCLNLNGGMMDFALELKIRPLRFGAAQ